MNAKKRTYLLTSLGVVDLACFALGGLFNYGDTWSMAGVAGLFVWLVLMELTQ